MITTLEKKGLIKKVCPVRCVLFPFLPKSMDMLLQRRTYRDILVYLHPEKTKMAARPSPGRMHVSNIFDESCFEE